MNNVYMNLEVLLDVEFPGAEVLVRGTGDAFLPADVEVQAHDRFRMELQAADGTPVGDIPNH